MAELPRVGFVGLGAMGNPMSGHLAAGGYSVAGFDVDADNMAKAVGRGVTQATSASEVGRQAGIVMPHWLSVVRPNRLIFSMRR